MMPSEYLEKVVVPSCQRGFDEVMHNSVIAVGHIMPLFVLVLSPAFTLEILLGTVNFASGGVLTIVTILWLFILKFAGLEAWIFSLFKRATESLLQKQVSPIAW